MDRPTRSSDLIRELTQDLAERGLLIEAGFLEFQHLSISPNVSAAYVRAMRTAWFVSAHHLWNCVVNVLEPEAEPTENDYARMSKIDEEIQRFTDEWLQTKSTWN